MEKLIKSRQYNKLIKLDNKNAILFIIKECKLSLKSLTRKTKKGNSIIKKRIIAIPLNDILEFIVFSNSLNCAIPDKISLIRSKITIENICNALNFIAKENGNRFIFRNLDIALFSNKVALSRLILNLSYHLLKTCKKQSAIQVSSYTVNKQIIIEFITICEKEPNQNGFINLNPLLKKINASFAYENCGNNKILFRITL